MSEESYSAFVSNYNYETKIEKQKTRIRKLELAARLKEVEHKVALVAAYQRGIERAREAVDGILQTGGLSPDDGIKYALQAIHAAIGASLDALTEAPETEGGE